MSRDHIRIERDGAVGVITIDRRERFNSLDVETAQDLRKAGLQLARDERGARGGAARRAAACSAAAPISSTSAPAGDGGDLGYLHARGAGRAGTATARSSSRSSSTSTAPSPRSAARPSRSSPPSTASPPPAASASRWPATWCSPPSAPRSSGPTRKTGLTGAESSTFFLPRLVGLRRALELVLLNPRLDARAALEAGLIDAGPSHRGLRGGGAGDGPAARRRAHARLRRWPRR